MKMGVSTVGDELIVEGKQLSPKKVRRIASGMDIPAGTLLPEVIIVGEDAEEELQEGPRLHTSATGESPSGYFITIPEEMLEKVSSSQIRDDLKHELAHYLERSELGQATGREETPYKEALKEVRAELRSGPRNLSLALARQARSFQDDYGLDSVAAFRLIERAARHLGVSKRIISRARKLCYGDTIRGWRD